ncbi:hypothetical protein BG000_005519, partial [Podila horticola]
SSRLSPGGKGGNGIFSTQARAGAQATFATVFSTPQQRIAIAHVSSIVHGPPTGVKNQSSCDGQEASYQAQSHATSYTLYTVYTMYIVRS